MDNNDAHILIVSYIISRSRCVCEVPANVRSGIIRLQLPSYTYVPSETHYSRHINPEEPKRPLFVPFLRRSFMTGKSRYIAEIAPTPAVASKRKLLSRFSGTYCPARWSIDNCNLHVERNYTHPRCVV